jgi:hypothetical protein
MARGLARVMASAQEVDAAATSAIESALTEEMAQQLDVTTTAFGPEVRKLAADDFESVRATKTVLELSRARSWEIVLERSSDGPSAAGCGTPPSSVLDCTTTTDSASGLEATVTSQLAVINPEVSDRFYQLADDAAERAAEDPWKARLDRSAAVQRDGISIRVTEFVKGPAVLDGTSAFTLRPDQLAQIALDQDLNVTF